VLVSLPFVATPVSAADPPPCGSERRWVSLEFTGKAWEQRVRSEVMEDLRAGFRSEGIDVCQRVKGQETEPLAAITLKMEGPANLSVTIELQDAVTEKRVSRDVSLATIPEDGRPLATAIAVDELLRASWAEVALDKQDPPKAPPPAEVSAAVRKVLPEPATAPAGRAGSWAIGVRAAVERYDRHTQVGADVFLRPRFTPGWGAELALGLRDGLAEASEHGRIDATASAVGLGTWLSLVRLPTVELTLELGARASRVVFSGEPAAFASGREEGGWALYGRAGVSPALRLFEPLWVSAVFGVGAPLKTFAASDDSRLVTGVRGVEWFGSLGVRVEF
jgi:hypothetical protein